MSIQCSVLVLLARRFLRQPLGNALENLIQRAILVFLHQRASITVLIHLVPRDVLPIHHGAHRIPRPSPLLHQRNKLGVHRHGAQKRHVELVRHGPATARPKDIRALSTVRAHKAAHVLHDTQHANARLGAEVELLAHIRRGHRLRRRHHHRAGDLLGGRVPLERLGEGDVLVRGAGGCVDEEVVDVGPQHVLEELPDHGRLLGPAPDDGVAARGEEKAEGHGMQAAGAAGRGGRLDEDGRPAAGDLGHLGGLDGEHARDGRAGQVDVEDADRVAGEGEGEGELRGNGGLSDAAFAGEDL